MGIAPLCPAPPHSIFKDSADQSTIDSYISQVQSKGGKLKQRFDSDIMKGFCADMPEEQSQEFMTLTKGREHEHM